MVKRIQAPVEHYLLSNSQGLVREFILDTLLKFSIEQLIKYKYTSRNFKSGLNFVDPYVSGVSRRKMYTFLVDKVYKEIPHSKTMDHTSAVFLEKVFVNEGLVVRTYYDPIIPRYVRRAARALSAINIPMRVRMGPESLTADTMEIKITPTPNIRDTLGFYRIMMILPEMLHFFKNLSRKARFTDENAKLGTRSKRFGRELERQAVRNSSNTAAAPRPTRAANNAGRAESLAELVRG